MLPVGIAFIKQDRIRRAHRVAYLDNLVDLFFVAHIISNGALNDLLAHTHTKLGVDVLAVLLDDTTAVGVEALGDRGKRCGQSNIALTQDVVARQNGRNGQTSKNHGRCIQLDQLHARLGVSDEQVLLAILGCIILRTFRMFDTVVNGVNSGAGVIQNFRNLGCLMAGQHGGSHSADNTGNQQDFRAVLRDLQFGHRQAAVCGFQNISYIEFHGNYSFSFLLARSFCSSISVRMQ